MIDLQQLLDDLKQLVECESPSTDLAAVERSAALVGEIGAKRLGLAPETIVIDGTHHLRWRLGDGPRRVLVVGHHDTVWPSGTLSRLPWSHLDGVVRGPGCFDMLTGVVMAMHAIASLRAQAPTVTLLITGDEEIGSKTSRSLIEAEARDSVAALIVEAAADGGAVKTRRKGVSFYQVGVVGRAAHAGLEPHLGVNASVEMAHQILAVMALGDPTRGTTVVPTAMSAGTTSNTVPAAGSFAVDVRAWDRAEQERVDAAIRSLRPHLGGASLEITGEINRPPLELEAAEALFARASALAALLSMGVLASAGVGGASDGNFTAGVGTPTLDGLGAVGGGAHGDDEHVVVAEIPRRTALLAALIADLQSERA